MIDYTYVRRTIENYLGDNFTTLPIVFENTTLEEEDAEHITLIDTDVASESMGMGDPAKLINGLVTIMIYTQIGSGTDTARAVASEILEMLNDIGEPIAFTESLFNSIGLVEDQSLYQHNLSIPYSYIYGQDDSNAC